MADNQFIYDKASATPELYKFQLFNPDTNELITLPADAPPMEWAEGTIQVDRDINVGGVFTSFAVDSLTFIKKGASFLRKIWDEKEMNGRCDLIVSYFKTSTRQYVEMPTRFSLNFATAKPRVKVGNQSIGFLIEATKNDILVKLENRRNKEVDISRVYKDQLSTYRSIKSIGGSDLLTYGSYLYPYMKTKLSFDSLYLYFQTIWTGLYIDEGRVNNNDDYHVYTTFNMNFNANDFSETNEVSWQTDLQSVAAVPYFYQNSTEEREVIFYYFFGIEVTNRKGGFLNPQNVYATFVEVVGNDGEVKLSERIQDIGRDKGTFYADDSLTINLAVGDSIRIYVRTDDTDGIDAYIRNSQFRLVQNAFNYSARKIDTIPIYEAFELNLQMISDTQFPFYSEFFGRTDLKYNINGDVYASENQLRFANFATGLHLRKIGLFDKDAPLPISFDDLFDTANAVWNIGYEQSFIDGYERIRIENYDFFFEDVEVLDLSDRLTKYDIETEIMPELAYSQVKSGFNDYSYELLNGRGEYNTENSRTSVINTDTVYNNISPIRGDSMGIIQKLTQEDGTEDTEEDNELFIIKTQKAGDEWIVEKQQNITILENTSLFEENSFNLFFTPTRMLLRHGNRIKGAFSKYLPTFLRFQKSNKLQTLKTSGEGYSFDITENDDIQVNDLNEPIWKPIKHIVTCKFTFADFETLMNNPKGYITFSSDVKGYLLSLKKVNNEDRATIEIIEKV